MKEISGAEANDLLRGDDAAAALAEADVRGRLEAQGLTIVAGPPADLDALVTREIRVFSQVVKEQGIKAE